MSAVRRFLAASFAVAVMTGLVAIVPATVSAAPAGNGTVVAMGPGCCK